MIDQPSEVEPPSTSMRVPPPDYAACAVALARCNHEPRHEVAADRVRLKNPRLLRRWVHIDKSRPVPRHAPAPVDDDHAEVAALAARIHIDIADVPRPRRPVVPARGRRDADVVRPVRRLGVEHNRVDVAVVVAAAVIRVIRRDRKRTGCFQRHLSSALINRVRPSARRGDRNHIRRIGARRRERNPQREQHTRANVDSS